MLWKDEFEIMLRRFLADIGFAVTKQSTIERLVSNERLLDRNVGFANFVKYIEPDILEYAVELLPFSRADIWQDIFAALVLSDVENGYFVEFGATNGVDGSNTFLFEKHLGWDGLLAEPARGWHSSLQKNRSVSISEKCVWSDSGTLAEFNEVADGGFSTLTQFSSADRHAKKRKSGKIYTVPTISLNDLLNENSAPHHIDFMSIDTEGSEVDILSAFDFENRTIGVLMVEHNDRPDRNDLYSLLTGYGYKRAPIGLSKFDDWYVCEALADKMTRVLRSSDT